jgi:signal transduction histidine kinase
VETAVDYMMAGAADYILKDRLVRVGAAVMAAIEHDRARREKTRAEEHRKSLEEQLLQAQKMEAIGRLAGGVAHDFNNVLTGILISTDLLLADTTAGDAQRMELEEIRAAADHAANLTRQLLAFGRKQVLSVRVVNLGETVAEVTTMLQRLIGEDVSLSTDLDRGVRQVRADIGQIEQVLFNLAINARDAMPSGGTLEFRTANVIMPRSPADVSVPAGEYVLLSVRDSGLGMDAQTRERIFEPFFTTKEVGKGTGLGLSTVYGIIRQHGGQILVHSAPGAGTTFELLLPAVDAPVDAPAAPAPERNVTGTETLLLVEDDKLVRDVTRRALTRFGYHVLAAGSLVEALGIVAAPPSAIDLLITDVVMPDVYGPELAERLKAAGLHAPVLFLSGYSEDAVTGQGALRAGSAFLAKPFTPRALARKVREVLGMHAPES